MKILNIRTLAAAPLLAPGILLAADDALPAPVLEWSIYILLMFAAAVAVGIFMRGTREKKSETLGDLLGNQPRSLHWVKPDCSVAECVLRMNEVNIGAMLVMEQDRLQGIFTERDVITRVLGRGLDPISAQVSDVMTRQPICGNPSMTLEEAMAVISSERVRHLPVVEGDRVIGMISSGDLTHWLIKDQSIEIR